MVAGLFHGSIRKKLVGIVLLAAIPFFIQFTYNNVTQELDHLEEVERELSTYLHGFSEVQQGITKATKTLLQTVAAMPEIQRGDKERAKSILGALLKTNPLYTNAILLDARGDVIAMGKGEDKGFNFSSRKHFRDAMASKQFSSGEFVVGKTSESSIFPFAMPVFDPAGNVVGAIIIGVTLGHYEELFKEFNFPEGSLFGVCDHNGNRLFRTPSTDNTLIGEPIKNDVYWLAKESGGAGVAPMTTTDGVDRLLAFESLRITSNSPPYMYMFMAVDEAEIVKTVRTNIISGVLVSLLAVGVAAFIAWWLGGKIIAAKLEKLAIHALKVGRAEDAPVSGEDYSDGELGQLYHSFDTMTALLKHREEDLQKAKLTAEEATDALRVNTRHLRAVVEAIPELVWLKDFNGVYVFCNQRFQRLVGASESEIVGKTDYDLVDMKEADYARLQDVSTMSARALTTSEATATYKDDGHIEDLEILKTPMYDDLGNIVGVLGVGRDITERKQFADELKESEIRYKALHDATFGGIVIHAKGLILDCNKGLEDLTGYSSEELVGMDGFQLIAESHREVVLDSINGKYEQPYEVVGVRKNGERYPLRLVAREIPYKGVKARAVEFRDITEQRKAEGRLRDSELRHRVIFENSPLGMVRFSDEGRILDCNNLFVELMGASREELIGFNTLEKSNKKMRKALGKALRGTPSSYEDYYTSVTGKKETYLYVQFNPVNIGRTPTEVIASLEDFSGRKEAQDKLQAAKEQAEAFSRSKTEFLTNMSHEIRTPLNGILGMLQLIQGTGLNSEQGEYVEDAITSSQRLTTLLTDILDLSRVEAGKLSIQQTSFDLKEACQQVLDLYRLTSDQSGVELVGDIDPDIPASLMGDPVRLQQVLTNLIGNSFKFTESGSVTLSAHLVAGPTLKDTRVLFSVADTGKGIPEDKLETLFESFTQVSEGYTRQHQGAGLGLAICKQLVTLMGGAISVESVEGEGTTMYISMPYESGGVLSVAEEVTAERSTCGTCDSLRVLLAEDERVNRLVTQRILEKSGHSVTVVDNGQEALDALGGGAFDVVLMDIQMPIMDGVAATKAIRSGAAGAAVKDIPIIAVTAYAMVGDREKFLAAGMNDYVMKPLEIEKLDEALKKTSGC